MKCRNCKKDFHYCPSCGFVPEVDLCDCCSERCAFEYFSGLSKQDQALIIAEKLMSESLPYFDWLEETISENKPEISEELLNLALKECGYARS